VKRVLKRVRVLAGWREFWRESRVQSPDIAASKQASKQDSGGQITKTLSPKLPTQNTRPAKQNWDQVFGGLEKLTKLVQCLLPLHGSNHAHLKNLLSAFFGAKVFLHWVAGKQDEESWYSLLLSFRHRLPRPKPWISWRTRKSTRLQAYKVNYTFVFKVLSTLLILRERVGWSTHKPKYGSTHNLCSEHLYGCLSCPTKSVHFVPILTYKHEKNGHYNVRGYLMPPLMPCHATHCGWPINYMMPLGFFLVGLVDTIVYSVEIYRSQN